MGRRKLSHKTQEAVVRLIKEGKLTESAIASQLYVSRASVSRIRKANFPTSGLLMRGRPRKLDTRTTRALVRLVTSGQVDTATDAQRHLEALGTVSVHAQTIRNALKRQGLRAVTKQKRPSLSLKHRKARLQFAQKYQNWTEEDWKRVVFSVRANRQGGDGNTEVWWRWCRDMGLYHCTCRFWLTNSSTAWNFINLKLKTSC
eukprot:c4950_g1_i1.p1 GENE.c4950_g1_i1~~c4950_g1_i1.p1  ORF type:complete len:202 (+),score=13.52 c4950_g1_i1:34-639(+)